MKNALFLIFSLILILQSFAMDDNEYESLNVRIGNSSYIRKKVGVQVCCEHQVKHGAILLSDFPALKKEDSGWFFPEFKVEVSLKSVASSSQKSNTLPPLKKEHFAEGAMIEHTSKKFILPQNSGSNEAFLMVKVLDEGDSFGKMKILPVLVGSDSTPDLWVRQNIEALKYLATREDIKVITIPYDYPRMLYHMNPLDGLCKEFIEAFANLLSLDKLVILAAGDDGAIFGHHFKLSRFCDFLKKSTFGHQLILVGATIQKSKVEVLVENSRKAGNLKDYFMVAPGEGFASYSYSLPSFLGFEKTSARPMVNTSFSASVVASSALILANQFPDLSMNDIASSMLYGAQKYDTESLDTFGDNFGHGVLNLDCARLLCDEKNTFYKRQKHWEAMRQLAKLSPEQGEIYLFEGKYKIWLPKDQKNMDAEEFNLNKAIYIPDSPAFKSLMKIEVLPESIHVYVLENEYVKKEVLDAFFISSAIPTFVRDKMSGIGVGFQCVDQKSNKIVVFFPGAENR